jgi:transmembrane sensor
MDSVRLARYLTGAASAAERAEVEAWAGADPANAVELARLRAIWTPAPPSSEWNIDAAWRKVETRLRSPAPPEVVPLRRRSALGWWLAAAAVLVLGLGLGRWWYGRDRQPMTFVTGIGEQRTFTLADSSRVSLAPASRLALRDAFGAGAREVELEGHAWFSVRHDPARPFRVTTAQGVIEDIGTEFQVETHGGEVQVAVMSGSVSVRSIGQEPAQAVVLGPRDVATVSANAAPKVSHEMAVDRIAGWRTGTLAFDGRPARVVLNELERWYPVSFTLSDSTLGDRHLFVTVPTADLQEAVDIIGAALGADAAQTGRVITLTPAGQKP